MYISVWTYFQPPCVSTQAPRWRSLGAAHNSLPAHQFDPRWPRKGMTSSGAR